MPFHAVTRLLMFFCATDVQLHFATACFWKVHGVLVTLPQTGGLLLLAALVVTGTPPFSIFQSEFNILSAGLAADRLIGLHSCSSQAWLRFSPAFCATC